MKIRKVSAKLVVILMLLLFTLSLAACETKYQAVKPDKDPTKIVVDKNYTADLTKEKGIQNGQVYIQNGMAFATMFFKKDVSDKNVKTIDFKYAQELKITYKDMKVNVQGFRGGKNVDIIKIEK